MKKYRKKPIVIEAEQWFPGKYIEGVERRALMGSAGKDMIIKTLEGDMMVSEGDYIIRGIEGELYPCKASIFEKTYDLVEQ
jgi:hypothetical protein